MATYRADTLIRSLRERKGLTQKQLAEGICAKDTLARIERGERTPSSYVFKNLMERLNENPDKYYRAIITPEEQHVMEIKDRISYLTKNRHYAEAANLMEEAMKDEAFNTNENRQYIVWHQAVCAAEVDKDLTVAIKLFEQAIRLTIPNFNEQLVSKYSLVYEEAAILSAMAYRVFDSGDIKRSTSLLYMLKESMDNAPPPTAQEKADCMQPLCITYQFQMSLQGRYEDAVEICKQGIAFCEKEREGYYPPLLWASSAYLQLRLGQEEAGKQSLRRAVALFYGLGRQEELEQNLSGFEKDFGITLSTLASGRPDKVDANVMLLVKDAVS